MTVKEIHAIYRDPEGNKVTMKTIYQYLKKLTMENLIIEAGQRVTEGSRINEKIFTLSAMLFFPEDTGTSERWWESEEGKTEAETLNVLLSEIFQVSKIDTKDFYDFFSLFSEHESEIKKLFFDRTKKSNILAKQLGKIDSRNLKSTLITIWLFGVFIQEPELLSRLRELINTDNQ
jgi:hypothetical protein